MLPDGNQCVVDEPVRESGAKHGAGRHQRVLFEGYAEVAGPRIGENATVVALRAQSCPDEIVKGVAVGTRDFGKFFCWLTGGCERDRGCDVGGDHRLGQRGRDPHGVAVGRRISDAADELEELRRAHDRERNRGFVDELLLGGLGAEVPAGCSRSVPTTESAPASAVATPSPMSVLTPVSGEAAIA